MATLVGIAGGTGSGKSTLANRLHGALGSQLSCLVAQDNYYRDLSGMPFEARGSVNYDHPESIDASLLASHLKNLKEGRDIALPLYDFARHIRSSGGSPLKAAPVVIVEGILVLVWPEVRSLLDVAIFVDCPADIRLARRTRRDIKERGRDVTSVLDQYLATVRPMHEAYVEPSRATADLVVPGFGDNEVVVRALARSLRERAREEAEES